MTTTAQVADGRKGKKQSRILHLPVEAVVHPRTAAHEVRSGTYLGRQYSMPGHHTLFLADARCWRNGITLIMHHHGPAAGRSGEAVQEDRAAAM